jgi:hypothetical protein
MNYGNSNISPCKNIIFKHLLRKLIPDKSDDNERVVKEFETMICDLLLNPLEHIMSCHQKF